MAIWLGIARAGGVGRAAQHPSRGRFARPLHRRRCAAAHHRRAGAAGGFSQRSAASFDRRHRLVAWRRRPRMARHRRGDRGAFRRRPRRLGADAGHDRRPRALRLHVRHHRPAEGGDRQPFPADELDPLVRRHDGDAADRPHVQLPADVSQRRRRGGDRRGAGQWRLGGRSATNSPPARSGTTSGATTARCSSTSASCAAICSTRLRRWRARRRTGSGCAAATGCGPTSGSHFKQRFRIPQILEFYAATEGNISLFNVEGRPGAIGRTPPFLAHRSALALVKFDVERGDAAARRSRALHALRRRTRPARRSARSSRRRTTAARASTAIPRPRETEKKILRNVFEPGDAWFRTGDLMRRDERRLLLFRRPHRRHVPLEGRERRDIGGRRGDHVVSRHPRCQCLRRRASPAPTGGPAWRKSSASAPSTLRRCASICSRRLPRYALPVLLRIRTEIDLTPTFKQRKNAPEQAATIPPPAPMRFTSTTPSGAPMWRSTRRSTRASRPDSSGFSRPIVTASP